MSQGSAALAAAHKESFGLRLNLRFGLCLFFSLRLALARFDTALRFEDDYLTAFKLVVI